MQTRDWAPGREIVLPAKQASCVKESKDDAVHRDVQNPQKDDFQQTPSDLVNTGLLPWHMLQIFHTSSKSGFSIS